MIGILLPLGETLRRWGTWFVDPPAYFDDLSIGAFLLVAFWLSARDGTVGRRYLADGERRTLGLLLAGHRTERDWRQGRAQSFDAYDAKAEAVALLGSVGVPVDRVQLFEAISPGVYHPGRSATLRLGAKTVLAEFGELHPAISRAFDIEGIVVAAELFLDAIPSRRGGNGHMRDAYAPPSLQAVRRDFAFLVAAEMPGDQLVRAVRGADKALIADVRLFDIFTGAGVTENEKSIAIEVVLQPLEKSFTDAELQAISDKIVAAAARTGARLRG